MDKITIKIVDVDLSTQSVIVKFASPNSQKTIDEYDGLAFRVPNYEAVTPEQFIETIRPTITRMVRDRDLSEQRIQTVDIESWKGYSADVNPSELDEPEPLYVNQTLSSFTNPEVEI